jgi:hypothetical protein
MTKRRRKDYMQPARDALSTTVGLSVGAAGLGVAQNIGAGLTGTTGTVFNQGALPMAATGLLVGAAPKVKNKKRRWF